MEGRVEIGKIYTTFGLKGDVKVYPYTEKEIFSKFNGKDVWIENSSSFPLKVKMSQVRFSNKKSFLVKLEGFDTVGKAKRIVGKNLTVPKSSLPPSKDGEYYFYEVIGMEVYDEENVYIGKVSDVIQTGANDVFVVKDSDIEMLVPVVEDYILELDKEDSRLKIRRLVWY